MVSGVIGQTGNGFADRGAGGTGYRALIGGDGGAVGNGGTVLESYRGTGIVGIYRAVQNGLTNGGPPGLLREALKLFPKNPTFERCVRLVF